MKTRTLLFALVAFAAAPHYAAAQLDPLLFLKRTQTPGATPAPSQPNVLLMVDTANRAIRTTTIATTMSTRARARPTSCR